MEKLLSLLSPFRWYLLAALMVATSLMTWRVLGWREDAGKLASCQESATKLKETNDALQTSRDIIASRLADAKRVRPACIPIKQPNTFQAGAEHAGENGTGISSEWLLEYAAEAELYRSERIALEKLLND